MNTTWYLAVLGLAAVLLVLYRKTGRMLKCIFFTGISGLCALGGVWLLGQFMAIPIGVTPLSALLSGVLGIPGVVAMLLFHLI